MTKNQHSQSNLSILVLGTGGTIAGLGGDAYTAAQVPIDGLIPRTTHRVVSEQIAQIDSKDMNFAVWERLYARLDAAMQDASIDAVVITHGTDTMEETAYFLHATLPCTKPVILTGAMRAADSEESDGPLNLSHALDASSALVAGVWIVFAGQVLPAYGVQKSHPHNLDAFGLRELSEQCLVANLHAAPSTLFNLKLPITHWPRVEILMNYAGATGGIVDALLAQKCDGIVVAGTGNGTLSASLEAALHKAAKAGIAVRLSTRCSQGSVIPNEHHAFKTSPLSPVQARVDLMLSMMSESH